MFPPVTQGMQAVHGDNVPLVYAFFLLTGHEGTVKYVVADRPCGNTKSFRCNIGVHPSGISLDASLVLPFVYESMVAALSWECEADFGGGGFAIGSNTGKEPMTASEMFHQHVEAACGLSVKMLC